MCVQARERQLQRAAEALHREQHPPVALKDLSQQAAALVELGDRLDQGTASEKVAAWKKVRSCRSPEYFRV